MQAWIVATLKKYLTNQAVKWLAKYLPYYFAKWAKEIERDEKQAEAKVEHDEKMKDPNLDRKERAKAHEDYINS